MILKPPKGVSVGSGSLHKGGGEKKVETGRGGGAIVHQPNRGKCPDQSGTERGGEGRPCVER